MAYDFNHSESVFPWELLPAGIRNQVTPVHGNLEPEAKFQIHLPQRLNTGKTEEEIREQELTHIADKFLGIMKSFHRVDDPTRYSFLDEQNGFIPNNYALVNLGQDTGAKIGPLVLPTMHVARNGYQYRERFAYFFDQDPVNNQQINQVDANAKTLLSIGGHRKEFETCGSPDINLTNCFDHFRQLQGVPDFFRGISQEQMYVAKTWMTSRGSIYSLTRVPGTDVYALLHHCTDLTKYTAVSFENFIGKTDPEWETEVKAFYGDDPRLMTEKGQISLIDILFKDIKSRISSVCPNIRPASSSKMERAHVHTEHAYADPIDQARGNRVFGKVIDSYGSGISRAFAQAVTTKIVQRDKLQALGLLALEMPDPRRLIDTSALNRFMRDNRPVQMEHQSFG